MSDKEAQRMTNSQHSERAFLVRRTILGILTVASISITLLSYGIRIINDSPERPSRNGRSKRMFLTKENSATSHGTSRVEAALATNTETATFALG